MAKKHTAFEEYAKNLDLHKLFDRLGASEPELLAREVEHFTVKESKRRDEFLINYFGMEGLNRIVTGIVKFLFSSPEPPTDAKVLDVGAGTGFFTLRVVEKVRSRLPKASFYAMDIAPEMLLTFVKKGADVHPFVGLAENLEGSIKEARRYFSIPCKFDVVFSTLMLHHSFRPEEVFKSIRKVLKENGKAIIIDLCEHSFEEFRREMGDVHLGFKLEEIAKMAGKAFAEVHVEKMHGICCECSGRSTEIFFAYLYGVLG